MHTVRTRRLLREVCGPDTGSMTTMDRETTMPISLVVGVVVVVLLAGCQQFASTTSTAAVVVQPTPIAPATANDHDSHWISQAHALIAKTGFDISTPDLSY